MTIEHNNVNSYSNFVNKEYYHVFSKGNGKRMIKKIEVEYNFKNIALPTYLCIISRT
jgi:hypothetical protein